MRLMLVVVQQRKGSSALHQIWQAIIHLLGNLMALKLVSSDVILAFGTSILLCPAVFLLSIIQNFVCWLAGQSHVMRGRPGEVVATLRRRAPRVFDLNCHVRHGLSLVGLYVVQLSDLAKLLERLIHQNSLFILSIFIGATSVRGGLGFPHLLGSDRLI